MNFLNLEYFIAVAEELSIVGAARRLYVSQQALSRHILKLEQELDTVLFIRGHPLKLTEDGIAFYDTAKSLLAVRREYDETVKFRRESKIDIHMAVNFAVGRTILPIILNQIFHKYPTTRVLVVENAPERVTKASQFDSFDVIVSGMVLDSIPKTFRMIRLHTKEQLLIVPKHITDLTFGVRADEIRRQYQEHGVDLTAFRDAPFIQMSPNTSAGNITQAYCQYFKLTPYFCTTIFNLDTAFHLACSGVGIMFYSKVYYDAYSQEQREMFQHHVDVFPIFQIPRLSEGIYLYFPENKPVSKPAEYCIELIKKLFEQYNITKAFSF